MKGKYSDVNDSISARRTRSQVAPDWTVTESLIFVNEIAAVEADCSKALSSYQLWDIIAGNCAALDVGRNLAQCRRKWHALLAEYDKASRAKKSGRNLDPELFEAIERVVKGREERGLVDLESDPEPGNEVLDATVEIGSRRKRPRSKSERYRIQKPKKCGSGESLENLSEKQDQGVYLEEIHVEEEPENHQLEEEYLKDFLEKSKLKCTAERPPKHVELHENHDIESPKLNNVGKMTISKEENEEILTLKLQELAIEIQAISAESADYKATGSQNVEDYHTEFTRRQGDKLIASLGSFSNTLKQLCEILQEF